MRKPDRSTLFASYFIAVVFVLLGGGANEAGARTRSFCSGLATRDCGGHLEPVCTSGSACDSGYQSYSGDPFPITIDCPFPINDQTVSAGCYSIDLLTCDDCGGNGEAPCPSGFSCAAGCSGGTVQVGDLCYSGCGGAGQAVCGNGECQDGHVSIAGICASCGAKGEVACEFGACDGDLVNQAGICTECGYEGQRECLLGLDCYPPNQPIGDNADGNPICGPCGGFLSPLACEGGQCDPDYVHFETTDLSASIGACSDFVEAEQVHFIDQNGACTPRDFETLVRATPIVWPPEQSDSTERGTVIYIHGRGSSCSAPILGLGGLYALGHLNYCFEYDRHTGDPRATRLLEVDGEIDGLPLGAPCHTDGDPETSCDWNRDEPVLSELADRNDVPAVADALADILALAPIEGEITIVAASQGGFIARQLMFQHYDALRDAGLPIRAVLFLGHPFYGPQMDASLYGPWACVQDPDGFDCATAMWLVGWNDLHTTGYTIDDRDYPQVEWAAVSGDGTLGAISESFGDDACVEVFGGVDTSATLGDGTVPLLSSQGFDEFGFYNDPALSFDHRIDATGCGHDGDCLLRGMTSAAPDILPAFLPPTGPQLDQVFDFDPPGGVIQFLGDGSDLAQSFRVGRGGTLTDVEVGLQTDANNSMGFGFSIVETLPNGFPDYDGTPLATGFISVDDLSLDYSQPHWISLGEFQLAVEVGDRLAVVLHEIPASGDYYVWPFAAIDDPTGFSFRAVDPSSSGSRDRAMRTWVDSTVVPEPGFSLLIASGLLALALVGSIRPAKHAGIVRKTSTDG